METTTIYSLTNGPVSATFDETVASIFNFGFRQSVFEVERVASRRKGKTPATSTGEAIVLRAGASLVRYPLLKPGDEVHCPGLGGDASDPPALYRIRRMAEGFGRRTMTELS